MVETDPILVRIQAIDEATPVIEKFTKNLMQIQNFKIPEIQMPQLSLGGGLKDIKYEIVNTIKPLKTLQDEFLAFRRVMDASGKFGKIKQTMVQTKEATEDYTKIWRKDLKIFDQSQKFVSENVFAFNNLDTALKVAGISQKEWNKFAKANFLIEKVGIGITNKLTGQTLSYGQAVQQAVIKSRRFKMEWLSIMFAGMALERVFNGIVSAQMDLWGVSDMLSAMWTITMLPAMEAITPKIYEIIEGIMKLTPDTQMVIGLTVLGGDLLGKLTGALGQIFLAVMGLKVLFPTFAATVAASGGGIKGVLLAIGKSLGGLGEAIMGISSTFALVAGLIIAAVVGIWLAFKENFFYMKELVSNFIEGFKQAFSGLITFFKGIFEIIRGIFSGNGDLIVEGMIKLFKGLWDMVYGLFKGLANLIGAIIVGLIRVIIGIFQGIINVFIAAYDKIAKLFGGKGTSYRLNLIGYMSELPSFKEGGIMPYTGLAMLHAGEKVIPKNQVENSESNINYAPTISINANVNSDYDVRRLATQLNKYWAEDFRRVIQTRG